MATIKDTVFWKKRSQRFGLFCCLHLQGGGKDREFVATIKHTVFWKKRSQRFGLFCCLHLQGGGKDRELVGSVLMELKVRSVLTVKFLEQVNSW